MSTREQAIVNTRTEYLRAIVQAGISDTLRRELIADRDLVCEEERIRRTLGTTTRCGRTATVLAHGQAYCFRHGKRYRDEPDYERIRAAKHTD